MASRRRGAALDHFADYCHERNARFALAFLPCYPQIYDRSASLEIRDLFLDCRELLHERF